MIDRRFEEGSSFSGKEHDEGLTRLIPGGLAVTRKLESGSESKPQTQGSSWPITTGAGGLRDFEASAIRR